MSSITTTNNNNPLQRIAIFHGIFAYASDNLKSAVKFSNVTSAWNEALHFHADTYWTNIVHRLSKSHSKATKSTKKGDADSKYNTGTTSTTNNNDDDDDEDEDENEKEAATGDKGLTPKPGEQEGNKSNNDDTKKKNKDNRAVPSPPLSYSVYLGLMCRPKLSWLLAALHNQGRLDTVEPNLNGSTNRIPSPIFVAMVQRNYSFLRLLLSPTSFIEGGLPLIYEKGKKFQSLPGSEGHMETIEDIKLNAANPLSPLGFAISKGDAKMVAILREFLKNHDNKNSDGNSFTDEERRDQQILLSTKDGEGAKLNDDALKKREEVAKNLLASETGANLLKANQSILNEMEQSGIENRDNKNSNAGNDNNNARYATSFEDDSDNEDDVYQKDYQGNRLTMLKHVSYASPLMVAVCRQDLATVKELVINHMATLPVSTNSSSSKKGLDLLDEACRTSMESGGQPVLYFAVLAAASSLSAAILPAKTSQTTMFKPLEIIKVLVERGNVDRNAIFSKVVMQKKNNTGAEGNALFFMDSSKAAKSSNTTSSSVNLSFARPMVIQTTPTIEAIKQLKVLQNEHKNAQYSGATSMKAHAGQLKNLAALIEMNKMVVEFLMKNNSGVDSVKDSFGKTAMFYFQL